MFSTDNLNVRRCRALQNLIATRQCERYQSSKSKSVFCLALFVAVCFSVPVAQAQQEHSLQLEEITVTARKRVENLQEVPISITNFSAEEIFEAGISDVQDFVNLTPNIIIRETFRAGATFITIRGITSAQQGWAPVTYVIDDVPVGSLDAINEGALIDIESIQILKGPQSALYGAGAIAGAIVVNTKAPSDEVEAGGRFLYGNGDDLRFTGTVSGPIKEGKVYGGLTAYFRDSDGTLKTTDGDGANFQNQKTVRGRLMFDLEPVQLDFRANYSNIDAGAITMEFLPSDDLINNFNTNYLNRGIRGSEDRELTTFSAKLDWDLGFASFTSVTGYSDIEQSGFGTLSMNKPPADSLCGFVGAPGDDFLDCGQFLIDNFKTVTQDFRLVSNSDSAFRWLVGMSYLDRDAENVFTIDGLIGADPRDSFNRVALFDLAHKRNSEFYGAYAQISLDIGDKTEVSATIRHDTSTYNSVAYTDRTLTAIRPEADGSLIQKAKDKAWQPAFHLSYNWTDNLMTYVSYGRGFRSGFFNSGNLTSPETSDNYEFGFKSTPFNDRLRFNGALFKSNYSNQQFTSVIGEAPFRITSNIPKTDILGLELEVSAMLTERLEVSAALGYTDSDIKDNEDGTKAPPAPFTSDATFNLSTTYTFPLLGGWEPKARIDYRRQGRYFINQGDLTWKVTPKDYLNARLMFNYKKVTVSLFAENVLNEQQANDFGFFGFAFKRDRDQLGVVRNSSPPRFYGMELAYRY